MINLIVLIIAYLFSNAKSPAQFQRTARPVARREQSRTEQAEGRSILVNWPDGRVTVLVV